MGLLALLLSSSLVLCHASRLQHVKSNPACPGQDIDAVLHSTLGLINASEIAKARVLFEGVVTSATKAANEDASHLREMLTKFNELVARSVLGHSVPLPSCDFSSEEFPGCVQSQRGTTNESQSFLIETWKRLRGSFRMTQPSMDGVNEVLILEDLDGVEVAVFKPRESDDADYVPGIELGGSCIREVAAYLVDYHILGRNKVRVPETALVSIGKYGLGSLQKFVSNSVPFSSYTRPSQQPNPQLAHDFQRIATLDMLIWNNDRHANNIRVSQDGRPHAIDHGNSFWVWPNLYMGGMALPMFEGFDSTVAIDAAASEMPVSLDGCSMEFIRKELKAIGVPDASILSFLMAAKILTTSIEKGYPLSHVRDAIVALGSSAKAIDQSDW